MPVLALLQVLEVPAPTAALPTPLMEQKQGSHCPVALGKWKAKQAGEIRSLLVPMKTIPTTDKNLHVRKLCLR